MRDETALFLVTVLCDLKHVHHRVGVSIQADLASVVVMFNVLLTFFPRQHPDAHPPRRVALRFHGQRARAVRKASHGERAIATKTT